jgi:1,4-dihydroxy-2-naphthoate octaprenyltransferase
MRPKTLPAGACPVFIAATLAAEAGAFHIPSFLACLAGALLLQILANFANDYSDGVRGTDTERLGPPRAVESGRIQPQVMKGAIILTAIAVFIPGTYIMVRGGPVYLAVGVASILSALAYTGGPYPLGYHGWGELFAFAFFGPVAVCGTYYLMDGTLPEAVVAASFAPGLFSVAILTVNNLRDIDGDRAAGKRTLPARFGKRFAQAEYVLSLIAATIGVPAYLYLQLGYPPVAFITAATLLVAVPSVTRVYRYTDPRQLNAVLAQTGQLLVVYSVLFAAGVLL